MFSFRSGLRELPDAMASALGDAVRLRTRVLALEHDGERWQLECESPNGAQQYSVHAVVATIPAHALAEIELPSTLRAMIEPIASVADVPVATLGLGFRRSDVAHPLDGFGVLMPNAEHSGILGALFSSSIFDSRAPAEMALITCMIGGARNRLAANEGEDALVRRALAALGPLLGIAGAPAFVHGMRWPHAIPQYELGHGDVVAAASDAEDQVGGLILAGSYRDGVSIGDRVSSGLRAGARAASLGPFAMEARRLG